jgi:hypothetical protein
MTESLEDECEESSRGQSVNRLVPALACDCDEVESCALVDSCGVECSNGRFQDSIRKASPHFQKLSRSWQLVGAGRAGRALIQEEA